MPIALDAAGWTSADDVYRGLLTALGAPGWHGRNLDALADSVIGRGINCIEAPFNITVCNASALPPDLRDLLRRVREVFAEADAELTF